MPLPKIESHCLSDGLITSHQVERNKLCDLVICLYELNVLK